MKYKKIILAFFIALIVFGGALCIQFDNVSAANKVKNNGNNYVEYKGNVYYMTQNAVKGEGGMYEYALKKKSPTTRVKRCWIHGEVITQNERYISTKVNFIMNEKG